MKRRGERLEKQDESLAVPAAHPAAMVQTASLRVADFCRVAKEVFVLQKKRAFSVATITVTAMLIACQVVLGNLLQVPMLGKQYNFGFVPIALAGALMGPIPAAIVGGLGDLIGAHIFPAGAYFPGFTLTNILVGIVCGVILHGKKASWWRCAAAVVISLAGVNLFLNSLWLSMLYSSKTYWVWVTSRAVSYLVEIPVQVILIYLCLQGITRLKLPAAIRLPKKETKA